MPVDYMSVILERKFKYIDTIRKNKCSLKKYHAPWSWTRKSNIENILVLFLN